MSLLSGAVSAQPQGQADPAQINATLRAIAAQSTGARRFTQTTESQWLEGSVTRSGFVTVEPDGTVVQVTKQPEPEIVRIRADGLSMTDASGQQRELPAAHPMVSGFLAGFRALLLGDLDTLRAVYDIQPQAVKAAAPDAAWRWRLVPHDKRLAKRITALRVSGTAGMIEQLRIEEADGDARVIDFSPLAGAGG